MYVPNFRIDVVSFILFKIIYIYKSIIIINIIKSFKPLNHLNSLPKDKDVLILVCYSQNLKLYNLRITRQNFDLNAYKKNPLNK